MRVVLCLLALVAIAASHESDNLSVASLVESSVGSSDLDMEDFTAAIEDAMASTPDLVGDVLIERSNIKPAASAGKGKGKAAKAVARAATVIKKARRAAQKAQKLKKSAAKAQKIAKAAKRALKATKKALAKANQSGNKKTVKALSKKLKKASRLVKSSSKKVKSLKRAAKKAAKKAKKTAKKAKKAIRKAAKARKGKGKGKGKGKRSSKGKKSSKGKGKKKSSKAKRSSRKIKKAAAKRAKWAPKPLTAKERAAKRAAERKRQRAVKKSLTASGKVRSAGDKLAGHVVRMQKEIAADSDKLSQASKAIKRGALRDQLAAAAAVKEARRTTQDGKSNSRSIKAHLASLKNMVNVVSKKIGDDIGFQMSKGFAKKWSTHKHHRAMLAQVAVRKMHVALADLEAASADGNSAKIAQFLRETQEHVNNAVENYSYVNGEAKSLLAEAATVMQTPSWDEKNTIANAEQQIEDSDL